MPREPRTYVALLRGINVGRNKRVSMARLRELLTDLGHAGVRTHLQSGNAVFTGPSGSADRLARQISQRIAADLGLDVEVLVRTADELAAVVAGNPLREVATDPARLFVAFLSAPPDPGRLSDLDPAAHQPDRFEVRGREAYLWLPNGMMDSALPAAFSDRRLGVTVTTRNWNTVAKLAELAAATSSAGR